MVAMIANREIDMNSGFIGLFLFGYYISSSGLWHVKLEFWTLARLFGSLFPTGQSRRLFVRPNGSPNGE